MALFSFTTPGQQQDQSAQLGMQQYADQGQGGVDPGKTPAMQGSQAPALGAALQQLVQQQQKQQAQQNGQFNAGQQAMAQGPQNGSIGPTVQNAAAQQQIMQQNGVPQATPSWGQQLSGFFNGQ